MAIAVIVIAVGAALGLIAVAAIQWAANLPSVRERQREIVLERVVDTLDSLSDEINYGFHVYEGRVVFEGSRSGSFLPKKVLTSVEGADSTTFRALDQQFDEGIRRVYYGVDRRNVFVRVGGQLFTLDADPSSFRLLDKAGTFASDRSSVYYMAIKIHGANPETFRRMKGAFSVDDDQAFLGHIALPADATTFQAFSSGYLSDPWHGGREYEGPFVTRGWCGDATNIYFGDKRVRDIDVATFEYLGFRNYAKDAKHVYYGSKIIEGASVESFEILGSKYFGFFPCTEEIPSGNGPDARDANRAYSRGSVFDGTGPWSRDRGALQDNDCTQG